MKKNRSLLGITGLSISIIHAVTICIVLILTKTNIIKYDDADFANILLMFFSPLISITGIIFSLFGIILKNKKIICIIGIIINGVILITIMIMWLIFIIFMMNISGSSLFTD